RVAKRKVRRAVLRVHRHGLRQRAKLLEAAGHAAEQLDLDGLGVPPAIDADDNAPGLTGARRVRRRESRDRDVMRAGVYGLRGGRRAAVQRRDQELRRVVSVGRIRMRRVEAGAGRPVAEGPDLGGEPHASGVEGLVKELDDIEHRRVEREESEVDDWWWRHVESEVK